MLNLDQIPDKAQANLSMALAFTQVKAGVDMLFMMLNRYEFLNDRIPPEWRSVFHLSLDEVSAECMMCMQKYRDAAITDVAQGIVDQLMKHKGDRDGQKNR